MTTVRRTASARKNQAPTPETQPRTRNFKISKKELLVDPAGPEPELTNLDLRGSPPYELLEAARLFIINLTS